MVRLSKSTPGACSFREWERKGRWVALRADEGLCGLRLVLDNSVAAALLSYVGETVLVQLNKKAAIAGDVLTREKTVVFRRDKSDHQ